MLYTELTKKAMRICFNAHRDDTDKDGIPYVFHPYHLAEQMDTEERICAALLHDVVEDTDWTLEELAAEGFPAPVMDALRLLTHDDGTPYLEYVSKLKDDPVASAVKLADLRHNSTVDRLPEDAWMKQKEGSAAGCGGEKNYRQLKPRHLDRLRKYLRAQAILTGGEADLEQMCLRITEPDPAAPGGMRTVLLRPDGTLV